jgi:hypothetical protein
MSFFFRPPELYFRKRAFLVLFRHLPELSSDVDLFLFGRRAIVLIVSLFALFCFSLELERLGVALGNDHRK